MVNNKILQKIVYGIVAFLYISIVILTYKQGFYDGMRELCDKDLLLDEKGNIYCDDLNNYDFNLRIDKEDYNFSFQEVVIE